MDLSDKTPEQLRTMLANAQAALGRSPGHPRAAEQARTCAAELARRGKARGGDLASIRWNPDAVDEALAPFVALSKAVPGNERTPHTRAGGAKIRGEVWIDTYSAIKANGVNRLLVCFVEKPGDDPIFALFDAGAGHPLVTWRDVVARADRVFAPDRLGEALDAWREVAVRAGGRA
jgi:hypothetical protein